MQLLRVDEILSLPEGKAGDCGVYFLLHQEEIVYVGSSVKVGARQLCHQETKEFDRQVFIPMDEQAARAIEKLYIKNLRPRYNKCMNPDYKPTYIPRWQPPKGSLRQIVLPKAHDAKVDEMMKGLGVTRADIIRRAIEQMYERYQRDKEKNK